MLKEKKFFAGMAVFVLVLGASLFFIGCGDPSDGAAGLQGPVYLTTSASSTAIQHAIDSGVPLVFAGVVQSDGGTVVIPAGRNVELVGPAAYTVENTSGVLIVESESSVTGTGVLAGGTTGVIVAPEAVVARATGTNRVVIQEKGDDPFDLSGGTLALRGPVTIGGGNADIAETDTGLVSKPLYVLGKLTVAGTITVGALPSSISVLGDVDVTTADQTQAVAWNISGKLDAKKLPTVGGALKVGGEAVFAETFTTGSAAINIGGKAEFKGALNAAANAAITVGGNLDVTGAFTTGTGAVNVAGGLAVGTSTTAANTSLGGNLTVGGTATFTGTFANTAGATATFGGATTITGVLTTGTGGLTIAGTGAVDLKAAPVTDTAKLLTVSNSGGVTLKEGINVGTVVGGLTIVAPGKVILSTGKAITADATGTVKAAEWSIGTAAGTATAAGDIILTDTGIKGAASGAKLTLAASGILVGLNGGAAIGATFDGVDVYLGGTTASVKIESGSSVSDVTTLTLANGAKISGLTGAAATGTAVATTTTGGAALGITNIDAVTGTVDEANAGNYLGIKTGASGTIAAAYNGAQKNYTIAIGTKATGTGA